MPSHDHCVLCEGIFIWNAKPLSITIALKWQEYEALQDRRKQMNETAIIFGGMLFELWELEEIPVTFKESLWYTLVDHATVYADERIVFCFKDGTEVTTML